MSNPSEASHFGPPSIWKVPYASYWIRLFSVTFDARKRPSEKLECDPNALGLLRFTVLTSNSRAEAEAVLAAAAGR
jgi:hypothetical protein